MSGLRDRLNVPKVIAFAAIVALSACGSSGTKARTDNSTQTSERGNTTTSLKSSQRPLINATTTSQVGNSTLVTAGDVDLTNVPAFTISYDGSSVMVVDRGRVIHTTTTEPPSRAKLSPDGKHLAVSKEGDAVRAATLEIIATADGKREQAFEADAKAIAMGEWSPDSTSIFTTSRTTTGVESNVVYRIDGSTQSISERHRPRSEYTHRWVSQNGTTTWAECTTGGSTCEGSQLVTKDHRSIYLASQYFEKRFGTFDAVEGRVTPLSGIGAQATGVQKVCGQYALLSRKNAFGVETFAVYDAETGNVTPVPTSVDTCPVVSSTGGMMAFGIPSGPIVVYTASGRTTKIAREGVPWGFSKDETTVLLYSGGSGTFRVATDGSGGKETSTRLRAQCAIGTTGKVLAQTDTAVVVYDIGSDSATEVADRDQIYGECLVTNDSAWVFSRYSIFDVASGKMGKIVLPKPINSFSLPFIWSVGYQTVKL